MSLVRRAYVSRLPVCMPALVLVVLGGGGLSSSSAMAKKGAPGLCTREALASSTVVRLIDGLADGRAVRTAGIEMPPRPDPSRDGAVSPAVFGSGHPSDNTGAMAPGAFRARATGREAVLTGQTSATERDRRVLVDPAVSPNRVAGSITNFLVAQGLARLAVHAARTAWLPEPSASARRRRRDAWRAGRSALFSSGGPGCCGHLGRTGSVHSVVSRIVWRESGGTIDVNYVNLGRRRSEDFTVTIAERPKGARLPPPVSIRAR